MKAPSFDELSEVVGRLSDAATRAPAAAELCARLGARSLFVFVPDPELDALVPAPGFPPTVPLGAGWDALLGEPLAPGVHALEVEPTGDDRPAPATVAVLADRTRFVLVGARSPLPPALLAQLPVLAALFRAEADVDAARAHARVAQDTARHANALVSALDAARAEAVLARKEAVAATRAKDEFLAMLGHELRNPLAPIVTALHLIKQRDGDGWLREHTIIERQVEHMIRLVDDLLDASRITRGKVELKRQVGELAPMVARAVEMVRPLVEERRHALTVSCDTTGLLLEVDPIRISQVIANLLTNAARYTEPGGSIAVACARDGGAIVVRVTDDGIGIDADVLPRIFDLFVQGGSVQERTSGGLGIGLALVRNLVELHGGTVAARSAGPGQGAEFEIRLPPAAAGTRTVTVDAPAPRPIAAARTRVLLVDDNVDAVEMLAAILKGAGHDVAVAHDGEAALGIAAGFAPELAILDIGLPEMDGYELAARLRQLLGSSAPRLIALSGFGASSDRRRSREAGFDHHFAKPVRAEILLAAVGGAPRGERRDDGTP